MNGDFYGLPTILISNNHLTLECLANAGPRIVRLFLHGSKENLLKELPHAQVGDSLREFLLPGRAPSVAFSGRHAPILYP